MATSIDKLLSNSDKIKQQEADLESIKHEIEDVSKKIDKSNIEEKKRLEALKKKIDTLNKEGSLKIKKELGIIVGDLVESISSIKEDITDYTDDIKLSYMNIANDFSETQKETQILMEEKLKQIGEIVGEKIDIAVKFIGSTIKNAIDGAISYISEKINFVLSNLGSLIKTGFVKLKNAILHPIEAIKALPGKIIDGAKWLITSAFNVAKKAIIGTIKFAFNLLVGTVKFLFNTMVKIVQGIVWVIGKVIQGLYWVVKQAFAMVFKLISKVLSFIIGVIWGALKAVGKFIFNVMWSTVKLIAGTVLKIAWTLVKTITQTIVVAIMSVFAPWLGLLALIGVGIYYLGKWLGWWGGNKDSKPGAPEEGGFFDGVWKAIKDKLGEWWKIVSDFFWKGDGSGILEKALNVFWNDNGTGLIQKFFSIFGNFWNWMLDKLKSFWKWITGTNDETNPFRMAEEQSKGIRESLADIEAQNLKMSQETENQTKELKELQLKTEKSPEDSEKIKKIQESLVNINKNFEKNKETKRELEKQKSEIDERAKQKAAKLYPLLQNLAESNEILREEFSDGSGGFDIFGTEQIDTIIESYKNQLETQELSDDKRASLMDAIEKLEEYKKQAAESNREKGLIEKLWDKISNWWETTAWPAITKFLSSAWKAVSKFITGVEEGGWTNPTKDSLLGKLYEIIFGTNKIDWGTNDGLMGYVNRWIEDAKIIILKAIDTVLLYTTKILESLGKFALYLENLNLPVISKAAREMFMFIKEAGSNVEEKRSETIGKQLLGAQASSISRELDIAQKGLKDLGDDTKLTPEQLEQKSILEKKIKELTIAKSQTTQEEELISDPQSKKNAFMGLNELLKFSLFAAAEQENSFMSSATGWKSIFDPVLNKYGKYEKQIRDYVPYKQVWYTFNANTQENQDSILNWVSKNENQEWFEKNILSMMKNYSSFFQPEDKDSINTMINRVRSFIGIMKNNNFDRDKTFNWNRNRLEEFRSDYIALYSTPSSKQSSPILQTFFGFENGGVIKPPTTKENMGRIITVAEAGDPEIVVPLNQQGLDYIKQISAVIQPEKSDTQTQTQINTKEISDQTKMPEKIELNNPYIASKEIERSDKTEFDIMRLVAMGVFNK